jgi:hypothetical protein
MFQAAKITAAQKAGLVVCLPKKESSIQPGEYRPITLLSADYKLLARILANRMRQTPSTVIHLEQYCGVSGRTIFNATAVVRGALAYAQFRKRPLCVLSLDFETALDNILHRYLFRILEAHGYHDDLLRPYRPCMTERFPRYR